MSTQPKPFLTPEEYLAIERAAEEKHEYFHGEMFAMASASLAHVRIVRNLVRHLENQWLLYESTGLRRVDYFFFDQLPLQLADIHTDVEFNKSPG